MASPKQPRSFSNVSQLHSSLTPERLSLLDESVSRGYKLLDQWNQEHPGFFENMPEPSRATIRYELIVQAARTVFAKAAGVKIVTSKNRFILVLDGRCGVHFKKMNQNGVGRPLKTKVASPLQAELPGMDAALEIIFYIAGYQLDAGGIFVENRLLNLQDGKTVIHQWSLADYAAEVRFTNFAQETEEDEGETVLRRKTTDVADFGKAEDA